MVILDDIIVLAALVVCGFVGLAMALFKQ